MSSLVEILAPGDTMSGKTYEDFVKGYWNWLLGRYSNNPIHNGVLYTRACYEYRYVTSADNVIQRNNSLCGGRPHQPPVTRVTTDTPIFCPMIDACFDETYSDESGNFDESLMRAACNRDIDRTERSTNGRFATVPTITGDLGGPYDIVPQPDIENHRMEIPQSGTFSLNVPANGLLRDKMEDPAPPGSGPFEAVAVGYYIVFKIKDKGEYIIRSSARGPREYIANMVYRIKVR